MVEVQLNMLSKRVPPTVQLVVRQVALLIWRRSREVVTSPADAVRLLIPPIIFFSLVPLGYAVLPVLADGAIEPFLIPFAFFGLAQRVVTQIMYEKNAKLFELMKIMGLHETAYWISHFLFESLTGMVISFVGAVITSGQFGGANFGQVLGLLLAYCLALVPFCFAMCALFQAPENASQTCLVVLFGCYVTYIVVFIANLSDMNERSAQFLCCLVPPLALQVGSGAFLKSYEGLPYGTICKLLVLDVAVYSVLTWCWSRSWRTHLSWSMWTQLSAPVTPKQEDLTVNSPEFNSAFIEPVDEELIGKPTVQLHHMNKTFRGTRAVNDLSFNLYESQIFALLGHNGAGKTTAISMLTGLLPFDRRRDDRSSDALIYGHSIRTDRQEARRSMGVCPQQDVLFDELSVQDHILFYSQLKGYSYAEAQQEVDHWTTFFKLRHRLENLGHQLSGGQRRKLSTALAVCGGSRLLILDEPTAGMDPLARRELWDLMSSLRQGRTILLTTHYMDEADALGDRVGIMAAGKMHALGTSYFLKRRFGEGYRLVVDIPNGSDSEKAALTKAVLHCLPTASARLDDRNASSQTMVFMLPFSDAHVFPKLLDHLETQFKALCGTAGSYGLSVATLEDVFVNCGCSLPLYGETSGVSGSNPAGVSMPSERFVSSLALQVAAMAYRRLHYAVHDWNTVVLVTVPALSAVGGSLFYKFQVLSAFSEVNALVANAIFVAGYLAAPGLLAGFVLKERNGQVVNMLRVSGCDPRAYWLGTFVADFLLLMLPALWMFICWAVLGLDNYFAVNGLNVCVVLVFTANIVLFSYVSSFLFKSYKACLASMPMWLLMLIVLPNFVYSVFRRVQSIFSPDVGGGPSSVLASVISWATLFTSPQGGLFLGLQYTGEGVERLNIASFPPTFASLLVMLMQCGLCGSLLLYIEASSNRPIDPRSPEEGDETDVESPSLDSDVLQERHQVMTGEHDNASVCIHNLRKVYPGPGGALEKARRVVAVEDMALHVDRGQVFGLLGANGAGKTSLISMLTRCQLPTSGDASVCGHSVLTAFPQAAKHMGIVMQTNTLWDCLTVRAHLIAFALLRGMPIENLMARGPSLIDKLLVMVELHRHQHKLAKFLSGGQKRKLCTAIALIGEPAVLVMDEISAGLDPVSRMRMWEVLRAAAVRPQGGTGASVVLTTHSMEEAEALCGRIGVIARGQLRALGSKQRLKQRFGQHFEVVVKLRPLPATVSAGNGVGALVDTAGVGTTEEAITSAAAAVLAQKEAVTALLRTICPDVAVMNVSAGVVTYRCDSRQAAIGHLFGEMERCKTALGVEDYSVSQPTLEQVVIHLVKASEAPLGDSTSEERTGSTAVREPYEMLLRRSRAKLGCVDWVLRAAALGLLLAALPLIVAGSVVGVQESSLSGTIVVTLGVLSLIAALLCACLLRCLCCRVPLEDS